MSMWALSRAKDTEIREVACDLLARYPDAKAVQLDAMLREVFSDSCKEDWPSLATFARFVQQWNEWTSPDLDIETCDVDWLPAVLRCFSASVDSTDWSPRWPSVSEAAWIYRIDRALPGIPGEELYVMAIRASRDSAYHRTLLHQLARKVTKP